MSNLTMARWLFLDNSSSFPAIVFIFVSCMGCRVPSRIFAISVCTLDVGWSLVGWSPFLLRQNTVVQSLLSPLIYLIDAIKQRKYWNKSSISLSHEWNHFVFKMKRIAKRNAKSRFSNIWFVIILVWFPKTLAFSDTAHCPFLRRIPLHQEGIEECRVVIIIL